jgi:hypothetical protein
VLSPTHTGTVQTLRPHTACSPAPEQSASFVHSSKQTDAESSQPSEISEGPTHFEPASAEQSDGEVHSFVQTPHLQSPVLQSAFELQEVIQLVFVPLCGVGELHATAAAQAVTADTKRR